jgi:hypothetical protein
MNQQERDEIREKHQPVGDLYPECKYCWTVNYPCDALQVLDVLDQIAFWVDHHNGMDVHGAIGRIQEMLL